MKHDFGAVVVGVGTMGSAALYHLASSSSASAGWWSP